MVEFVSWKSVPATAAVKAAVPLPLRIPVSVVAPVPPNGTVTAVAFHVPVVIVPSVVIVV